MKLTDLTDKQKRLMSEADRKSFGKHGMTAHEANKAFVLRSEKDLHRQIRNLLNLNGIPFCEARMDRKSSITIGWPDITFAVDGIPVAWELKFLGALSPDQARVKIAMEKHGWKYRVIRSLVEAQAHLLGLNDQAHP